MSWSRNTTKTMNEQLQPLIDLLTGKFGWLATVLTWMSACRLALKPFSARIQQRMMAKMAEAAEDPEDTRDWESILHRRWYRTMAFALDLVFSFKLPTHADFAHMLAQRTQQKG